MDSVINNHAGDHRVSCAAVIVTFNPKQPDLKYNIEKLSEQVEKIIIVDNGSRNCKELENIVDDIKVEIILNEKNMGIAAALNIGFEIALKKGYQWCLSMDQDTECPDGMVESLYKYTDEQIGILCPAVYYEGTDKYIKGKSEVQNIKACMTSGSLTSLKAWKQVEGFDETFFIDFVDNDFCMKLKLKGYRICRVNSCTMKHHLGDVRELRLFGIKKVKYTYHSPLRYYYMIRNNIVFVKRYGKHLKVIKEYLKVLYIALTGLLYTPEKSAIITYIRRGAADAICGRMGEFFKR